LLRACFALALGVGTLTPIAARSQSGSADERLDRLERDLNMLQRQVYRGAPLPLSGDTNQAVNAEIRMDQLEAEVRDLTGRVEQVMNQVDQVRRRVEQVNGDIDMRLGVAGVSGPQTAAPQPLAGPRTNARQAGMLPYPPVPPSARDD